MYAAAARRLLRRYDGYECKEPEPGKFTLAFRCTIKWRETLMCVCVYTILSHRERFAFATLPLQFCPCAVTAESTACPPVKCSAVAAAAAVAPTANKHCRRHLSDALCWACHLQEELLLLAWPATLLRMPECAETRAGPAGELLWRGLRVRVGMAYGMVSSKKPLNTGRADYFGVLANGAARVSALAAPGQVGQCMASWHHGDVQSRACCTGCIIILTVMHLGRHPHSVKN